MALFKVKYPVGLTKKNTSYTVEAHSDVGLEIVDSVSFSEDKNGMYVNFSCSNNNLKHIFIKNNTCNFKIPVRVHNENVIFETRVHFSINKEISFLINPKGNTTSLKELYLIFDSKEVCIFSRNNMFQKIDFIEYKAGKFFGENIEYKIKYLYETDDGRNGIVETNVITVQNLNYEEIKDITHNVDYKNKKFELFWNCSSKNYEVTLKSGSLEKTFFVKENKLTIDDINSLYYKTDEDYLFFVKNLDNNFVGEYRIECVHDRYISPHVFNVDYSGVLPPYRDGGEGYITWNNDISWSHSFEYCLRVDVLPHILYEYSRPWEYYDGLMKDKPYTEFSERYSDDESVEFDAFKNNTQKTKNVFCNSSYVEEWKNIGSENSILIPLWFSHVNQNGFSFSVRVLDKWGNVISTSNEAKFKHTPDNPKNVSNNNPRLYRNQEICFGEGGTVDEFKDLENPSPNILHKFYSYDKFKDRYNLNPLNSKRDTDFDGNSLFYYLNASSDPIFTMRREDNWHYIGLEVFEEDGTNVFPLKKFYFNGEEYKDNLFQLNKEIFKKEGRYTLKIRTYNISDVESKIAEINYNVYKEAPGKPMVSINENDFYENEIGELCITKNFFTISVTNNSLSEKYNGWKYKEAHFYFKDSAGAYKSYPDYIAWTTNDRSSLDVTTNTIFSDGLHDLKVCCYDYAGNQTDFTEIKNIFINRNISITPSYLITGNDSIETFIWKMKLNLFTIGFSWKMYHSKFKNKDFEVIASGYIDTNNEESKYLDIPLSEGNGFYYIEVEEFNDIYPDGTNIKIKSNKVELSSKTTISPKLSFRENVSSATINKETVDEWIYTKNINELELSFIHTGTNQNGHIPKYILKMIAPDGTIFLIEKEITFSSGRVDLTPEIQSVDYPKKEGVWEFQLIKIDETGNSNEISGYYSVYVLLLNRKPHISGMTPYNSSGINYFGINNKEITYKVDSISQYSSLPSFTNHKEKFTINNYRVKYITVPYGNEVNMFNTKPDKNSIVKISNDISSVNINSHSRDGEYVYEITAIDYLGRESEPFISNYIIDTDLTGTDVKFYESNTFFSKKFNLVGQIIGDVQSVYYTFSETKFSKDTWNRAIINVGENGKTIKVPVDVETKGVYVLKYRVEEKSGNITGDKYYNFKVEDSSTLYPVFDFGNKVFFNYKDENIYISWKSSNAELKKFKVALSKIEYDKLDGNVKTVSQFRRSLDGTYIEESVGSDKENWIETEREIYIPCSSEHFKKGYYSLKVVGEDNYGLEYENSYRFQYDPEPMDTVNFLNKSTVSITNNTISWDVKFDASYYEISYDKKEWFKTFSNQFNIDYEKVTENSFGQKCVYHRWVNYYGNKSEISTFVIDGKFKKLEAPKIKCINIIDNIQNFKWDVSLDKPEDVSVLMYSFDRINWKKIEKPMVNNTINYEYLNVEDGIYTLYCYVSEDEELHNISEISSESIRVARSYIPEKPIFDRLIDGNTYRNPAKLFITNREEGVKYRIKLNGKIVPEGYEVMTETLKTHNISVEVKVDGLNKTFHFYEKGIDNSMHVYDMSEPFTIITHGTEKQLLSVNGGKILVELDTSVTPPVLSVNSQSQLSNTEYIIYKERELSDWKILNSEDKLDATKEYNFKINKITLH